MNIQAISELSSIKLANLPVTDTGNGTTIYLPEFGNDYIGKAVAANDYVHDGHPMYLDLSYWDESAKCYNSFKFDFSTFLAGLAETIKALYNRQAEGMSEAAAMARFLVRDKKSLAGTAYDKEEYHTMAKDTTLIVNGGAEFASGETVTLAGENIFSGTNNFTNTILVESGNDKNVTITTDGAITAKSLTCDSAELSNVIGTSNGSIDFTASNEVKLSAENTAFSGSQLNLGDVKLVLKSCDIQNNNNTAISISNGVITVGSTEKGGIKIGSSGYLSINSESEITGGINIGSSRIYESNGTVGITNLTVGDDLLDKDTTVLTVKLKAKFNEKTEHTGEATFNDTNFTQAVTACAFVQKGNYSASGTYYIDKDGFHQKSGTAELTALAAYWS